MGFGCAVLVGTLLLLLPGATEPERSTTVVPALFTAVSAVCVTGLTVVDTATHWSTFGELVILGLIQVGGAGIMTLASLLGLLVTRRLGLRMLLSAQTESKSLGLGDARAVVRRVLAVSLAIEVVVAAVLALRFATQYDFSPGRAAYLGVFHAASAFNSAGFALFPDSLASFGSDPWICLPVIAAVVLGGIGFPVLFELGRRLRGRLGRWSLHVRLTIVGYVLLLIVGVATVLVSEWTNPATLGQLGVGPKFLAGLFHGIMPRSTGFSVVDVGAFEPVTLLVIDVLMFIGGGSAGTAGGIKVTTVALLVGVVVAEVRGEPSVHLLGRRVGPAVQRQALAVAFLGSGLVVAGTIALLSLTTFGLDAVLFEVISAAGTVGLSTGITPNLPVPAQLVLTALMFLGRLGPITLASALALRERTRRYERPEERPIVG